MAIIWKQLPSESSLIRWTWYRGWLFFPCCCRTPLSVLPHAEWPSGPRWCLVLLATDVLSQLGSTSLKFHSDFASRLYKSDSGTSSCSSEIRCGYLFNSFFLIWQVSSFVSIKDYLSKQQEQSKMLSRTKELAIVLL